MDVSVWQIEDIFYALRDEGNTSLRRIAQKVGVPSKAVALVLLYGHLPPSKLSEALLRVTVKMEYPEIYSIMRETSPESWGDGERYL